MKTIRYLSLFPIFGLLMMSGIFSSCNKDETSFADPTIAVTPATAEQSPGNTVTFSIAVTAEAGIASVTLDGTSIKTYTVKTTSDAFSYEYTVAEDEAVGAKTLSFLITDEQSSAKTATASVSLTVTESPIETITVNASISTATTWSASNHYLLKGNVYVESGAELTIEAGTLIFGDKETKGALIVSRGGKIHAVGTATNPIIFTSAAPKTFRNYGDWGGVIILGKAPNNQSDSKTIEGISAATGDNGLYGGTDAADNSGEFQYCRIEFAGIPLSTDNEINGLTMGSVGSATQIDHVQVSFSGDDSYEWFGGSVNTDHLVAFRGWDDEFDTDFGFSGVNQFLVSYRDPNIADKSGSNGFESDNDGDGSDKTPLTQPIFANVTFFGPFTFANLSAGALANGNVNNNFTHGGHLRRNSAIQIYNSAFVGSSKVDGILFDKTNAGAVFMGNYIGRITGAAKNEIPRTTNPYDAANFATDNTIQDPINTVDLSALFAGLNAVAVLVTPPALLAANSSLLTDGVALPNNDNLVDKTVVYVGAFNATENWMTGWTNFDPNNTEY